MTVRSPQSFAATMVLVRALLSMRCHPGHEVPLHGVPV